MVFELTAQLGCQLFKFVEVGASVKHSHGTLISEDKCHISFCEFMRKLNSSSFQFPSPFVAEATNWQRRAQLPAIPDEKGVLQLKSLSFTICATWSMHKIPGKHIGL